MRKLKAVIDRIEDDKVVIVFEDSHKLIVKIDFINFEAKEGDLVSIKIKKEQNKNEKTKVKEKILEIIKKQTNV